MDRWLGFCQQLYNAALQERRDAWRLQRKAITRYDQHAQLTEIRASDPDAEAVPALVARSALDRLDEAFRAFFRRVKDGSKPGYPRFRSHDRYDSFSVGRARVDDHVHVPKLGPVRFNRYRPWEGSIRDVKIKRAAGRWWVFLQCDVGEAPAKVAVRSAVGVDVGLKSFAVLSDGTEVENPRFFRSSEKLLADRQRRLSTKRRGSTYRRRSKLLVQKAHERVRNQRLDFARKLSSFLCDRYDLIAVEDLEIRRMIGDGSFSKSISDAAWGTFFRALACKAERAGKHLVKIDPRGTSQRCSSCHKTVPKRLGDRRHECGCGLSIDRDLNAALNVLHLGMADARLLLETKP